MDYSSLPIFNIMKSKLNFYSERQSLLAENVANADTPGYKAKDVQEPDFKKMLKQFSGGSAQKLPSSGGALSRTHAGHLGGMSGGNGLVHIDRKKTDELNPNGNNVSVEEEMAKVSQNQGDYLKTLNLYAKTVSLLKIAIGNPNNG